MAIVVAVSNCVAMRYPSNGELPRPARDFQSPRDELRLWMYANQAGQLIAYNPGVPYRQRGSVNDGMYRSVALYRMLSVSKSPSMLFSNVRRIASFSP